MYDSKMKVLITTNDWFLAPDGQSYKAVWGTVVIKRSEDLLGIKPHNYVNWFAVINGSCIIAGCQIHYAVVCDEKPVGPQVYIPAEIREISAL